MTVQEAQERSPVGVAVLGNPINQDVIWPKGSPCAYLLYFDHYKARSSDRWTTSTEWEPVKVLMEPAAKLLAELRALQP